MHAALEARRFLSSSEHPHLVLCGVPSQERLLAAADFLFCRDVRHALFREPDLGGQATALATEPLRGERREVMQRFRCLQSSDFLGRRAKLRAVDTPAAANQGSSAKGGL